MGCSIPTRERRRYFFVRAYDKGSMEWTSGDYAGEYAGAFYDPYAEGAYEDGEAGAAAATAGGAAPRGTAAAARTAAAAATAASATAATAAAATAATHERMRMSGSPHNYCCGRGATIRISSSAILFLVLFVLVVLLAMSVADLRSQLRSTEHTLMLVMGSRGAPFV